MTMRVLKTTWRVRPVNLCLALVCLTAGIVIALVELAGVFSVGRFLLFTGGASLIGGIVGLRESIEAAFEETGKELVE